MNKSRPVILQADDVSKTYDDGVLPVHVLKKTQLCVKSGEKIAIIGPSGSGKSTLLHLLGGLDKPTSGRVCLDEVDWFSLSEKKRCAKRNRLLGFIYQFHHLLPEFSALENVAMPLLVAGVDIKISKEKATVILEKVGLGHRLTHKPSMLSGGERQRVAIARALIHQPRCILADEPTGNLDTQTAEKIFDLMLSLNQLFDTALVMVTHDEHLANKMDKVFYMVDGRLLEKA